MSLAKQNLTMDKTMGLISSLFDIALSDAYHTVLCLQCCVMEGA